MKSTEPEEQPHRILIIDDNPRIHEDIRKILCPASVPNDLTEDEAAIFGAAPATTELSRFEMDSAHQGQEGLALVEKALAEKRPYAMAFVDLRMPPGWDGIETIRRIWSCYPELQVVICTAYSDHSWADIIGSLGKTDSLLILKKPFDNVEVLQLAHALTKKWVVTGEARKHRASLESMVGQGTMELARAREQLQTEIRRCARMEQDLSQWAEGFQGLFETVEVPLAIFEADSLAHAQVNRSYLSLIRRPREQVIGKTPEEIGMALNSADFEQRIKTLHEGHRLGKLEDFLVQFDRESWQKWVSAMPVCPARTVGEAGAA